MHDIKTETDECELKLNTRQDVKERTKQISRLLCRVTEHPYFLKTRAESSLRSGDFHYYNISRTILMIKSLKIVTYVFYGSWLVVTCLGIAPYCAISELLFGIPECFTMSGYCTMLCNSRIDGLFRNQPDVTWPDVT